MDHDNAVAPGGDHHHGSPLALAVGALGIVYGDIGTSPLYAFREAFEGHDLEVTEDGILGACSLTFWALVVVISLKYLMLVMRADNKGEGGILALTALLPKSNPGKLTLALVSFGIFGTALLYGDGMITPAISVLSAVEGVGAATTKLDDWIVPIAVVIIAALFLIQSRGTAGIAKVFGPIMLLWFVVLAVLGTRSIASSPEILEALNPVYAAKFFTEYRWNAFFALGSIFLVVTGGEALYADMGHFGRGPIQLGWFSLVFPALVLNYFGQGALLLRHPEHIELPFFHLGPHWALWPLVILATIATVIASQALISGAFSLTTQGISLDYLPRVAVKHTSSSQIGQVYVPIVNWIMMAACIGLVLGFRTSSNLAAAYGIAVTTTMAITTMLFMSVAIHRRGWSKAKAIAVGIPLLLIDFSFFGAQLIKIPHGGWFAIGVGLSQFLLMITWRRGRQAVAAAIRRGETSIEDLVAQVRRDRIERVPGAAVFLFKDAGAAPPALLKNVAHNQILHEHVLLVSILTADRPNVPEEERSRIVPIADGIWQIVLTFGYRDEPNVPEALVAAAGELGAGDPEEFTYFLGRESIIASKIPNMPMWQERIFVLQTRTAASAARFFHLPAQRVFEVGTTVEI